MLQKKEHSALSFKEPDAFFTHQFQANWPGKKARICGLFC